MARLDDLELSQVPTTHASNLTGKSVLDESHEAAQPDPAGFEDIRFTQEVGLSTPTVWKLKVFSASLAFFIAGVNDGSLGALIPYILRSYDISTGLISVIYGTSFIGWLIAALFGSYIRLILGLGGTLATGAFLQLLSQVLRVWHPPFTLFAITFTFAALGQAFQDAQANTFVSAVSQAHRWLAVIHGSYAFGCVVGPLIAAAMAMHTSWSFFYFVPLGLGIINLLLSMWAFRDNLVSKQSPLANTTSQSTVKKAWTEMRTTLSNKAVWLLGMWYFFYLGVAITISGWLVQYLVVVRGEQLSRVDYLPTGYNGGVAVGRLVLAEPTHRLGEKRMLLIYTVLCLALQIVFWRVGNLIADGIVIGLLGFLLGPFFATGVSISTKILPSEIHSSALGLIFVVAQAGGNAFPAITGVIASRAGVAVLQPILVGLIMAMGISWLIIPAKKIETD